VVQAVLTAGYFRGIASACRTGAWEFLGTLGDHVVPFLIYTFVRVLRHASLALLGLFPGHQFAAALVILLPIFLVAVYLFYGTPHQIVLRGAESVTAVLAFLDRGLRRAIPALRRGPSGHLGRRSGGRPEQRPPPPGRQRGRRSAYWAGSQSGDDLINSNHDDARREPDGPDAASDIGGPSDPA
jgi:hypothetical protein